MTAKKKLETFVKPPHPVDLSLEHPGRVGPDAAVRKAPELTVDKKKSTTKKK